MPERPMLFQDDLVRAILAGRKTVTRRPVVHRGDDHPDTGWPEYQDEAGFTQDVPCPYGKPGDVLWVRECFARITQDDGGTVYEYRADGPRDRFPGEWPKAERANPDRPRWCPSIHMPRAACRIRLIVTSVTVERVQNITSEDAQREGFEPVPVHGKDAGPREEGGHWSAIPPFRDAWSSIYDNHPKKPWAAWGKNPWVWRIEFKLAEVRR